MTREEAIAYGKRAIDLGLNDETQAFCELAIKALEQQPCCKCIEFKRYAKEMGFEIDQEPCDDTISRADAVRVASGYCHPANIAKELAKLPPVTPQPKVGHSIPLDKVEQAKEEISKSCYKACITDDGVIRESKVLEILDKLIEGEG